MFRNIFSFYKQHLYKQHETEAGKKSSKSNTRLKLAKNQAKSKQHPKAELLLFENCYLNPYACSYPKIGHIIQNV